MAQEEQSNHRESDPEESSRRGFLKKAASTVLGGGLVAGPVAAGVIVLVDPLRRKSGDAEFVRIAGLEALPEDGSPQAFQVFTDRRDAWNYFPDIAVGSIYLSRRESEVVAFNTSCPHAGCAVDFIPEDGHFFCPCHSSAFALDGSVEGQSPSPRGLDVLETEVRDGEVWVKFQNFKAGITEKLPIA